MGDLALMVEEGQSGTDDVLLPPEFLGVTMGLDGVQKCGGTIGGNLLRDKALPTGSPRRFVGPWDTLASRCSILLTIVRMFTGRIIVVTLAPGSRICGAMGASAIPRNVLYV